MGAVDPHAAHAGIDETADEFVVVRGGRGHRHHDADGQAWVRARWGRVLQLVARDRGGWAEQGVGVVSQLGATVAVVDRVGFGAGSELAAVEFVEDLQDGVHGAEDVRFRAAHRREAEAGEFLLDVAQVAAAEREVVQQVARALPVALGDACKLFAELALEPVGADADGVQGVDETRESVRFEAGDIESHEQMPRQTRRR